MKLLRKSIIALILASSSPGLYGEELKKEEVKNSYTYWAIGAGIPTFLSVKVGHREQVDHQGFDIGMGVTPLVGINEIHAFTSYLYYPNPSHQSQAYLGLGLRAGCLFGFHDATGYIGPGVILGKEYFSKKGRRFVQAAVGGCTFTTDRFMPFSSISLTFGYSF